MLKIFVFLLLAIAVQGCGTTHHKAFDYAYCIAVVDSVSQWQPDCIVNSSCNDNEESTRILQKMKAIHSAVEAKAKAAGITQEALRSATDEKMRWVANEYRLATPADNKAFKEWINTTVEICDQNSFVPPH